MAARSGNIRARATLHKMVANGGKRRSLAQSMREAGYAESYARNPQKLKKTRAWREYLDELLPDTLVISSHRKLMDARRLRTMTFPSVMKDSEIEHVLAMNGSRALTICRGRRIVRVFTSEVDYSMQRQAVDLAYRARGLYKQAPPMQETRPFGELTDPQLNELIKEARRAVRKT